MASEEYYSNYKKDGYVIIRKGLGEKQIDRIHDDLAIIFKDQTCTVSNDSSVNTVNSMVKLANEDKNLFYKKCLVLGDLASMSLLNSNSSLSELLFRLMDEINLPFSSTHAGLFYNQKDLQRLQYGWHQEATYYPHHIHGIHLWFPLFNSVKVTGGPMLIKKGSHKFDFEYTEIEKENHLSQKLIDSNLLTPFETISCELNLGDIVVFDHKTAHCTDNNLSGRTPRISGLKRFLASENSYVPCSYLKGSALL